MRDFELGVCSAVMGHLLFRAQWSWSAFVQLPPVHFLDATSSEEASAPIKLLLAFAFPANQQPSLQAMRMMGSGELVLAQMKSLLAVSIPEPYYLPCMPDAGVH